jgi:hypothetical protein
MLIHDGRYDWPASDNIRERPVSWWTSSYRVQIFDLRDASGGLPMLQPHLVILTDTGAGASAENCLPELAKHICRDFGLPMPRVRWVEQRLGASPRYEVVTFTPLTTIGGEPFFRVTRRPPDARELDLVNTCLESVRPPPPSRPLPSQD